VTTLPGTVVRYGIGSLQKKYPTTVTLLWQHVTSDGNVVLFKTRAHLQSRDVFVRYAQASKFNTMHKATFRTFNVKALRYTVYCTVQDLENESAKTMFIRLHCNCIVISASLVLNCTAPRSLTDHSGQAVKPLDHCGQSVIAELCSLTT